MPQSLLHSFFRQMQKWFKVCTNVFEVRETSTLGADQLHFSWKPQMPPLWFHFFLQDAGQGPVPLGRQNPPLLTAGSAPVERIEPGKQAKLFRSVFRFLWDLHRLTVVNKVFSLAKRGLIGTDFKEVSCMSYYWNYLNKIYGTY